MIATLRKLDKWRVSGVEYLSVECLDDLQMELDWLLSFMPFKDLIVDYEICGSYAFNCADDTSDIDIDLAPNTWEEVLSIRQNYFFNEDKTFLIDFCQKLDELSDRLGIKVEAMVSCHDNKLYNECFSLKERKLYNRKAGEVVYKRRKWNSQTNQWEDTTKLEKFCDPPFPPKVP